MLDDPAAHAADVGMRDGDAFGVEDPLGGSHVADAHRPPGIDLPDDVCPAHEGGDDFFTGDPVAPQLSKHVAHTAAHVPQGVRPPRLFETVCWARLIAMTSGLRFRHLRVTDRRQAQARHVEDDRDTGAEHGPHPRRALHHRRLPNAQGQALSMAGLPAPVRMGSVAISRHTLRVIGASVEQPEPRPPSRSNLGRMAPDLRRANPGPPAAGARPPSRVRGLGEEHVGRPHPGVQALLQREIALPGGGSAILLRGAPVRNGGSSPVNTDRPGPDR